MFIRGQLFSSSAAALHLEQSAACLFLKVHSSVNSEILFICPSRHCTWINTPFAMTLSQLTILLGLPSTNASRPRVLCFSHGFLEGGFVVGDAL